MEDNKELLDFDLDDILSEFQDLPQEDTGEELLSGELESLLGDWATAEESAEPAAEVSPVPSTDTIRMNELVHQVQAETCEEASAESEPAAEAEEAEDVPMDTIRMNELISQIAEETAATEDPQTAPEESPVSTDDTIRVDNLMEQLSAEAAADEDAVSDDATIRMELPDLEVEASDEIPTPEESPNIIYNPRTRLRELKKKLVAGPERRYYELSEVGIGRLQLSIALNLVIVVLCAVTTTFLYLDMIPANRMRFVIFSQVLAMLLSAFFGSPQMLDGLGELFRGRFSLNTLLSFTFAACCADAVFCLSELRVPCCAAFSLEITMALWARYQRHATEQAQMDSLRKAVRLHALVKQPGYYEDKAGILRRDGEVEDFMDHYNRPSGPAIAQGVYALVSLLLCIAIAVFAGMNHGISMGVQILSTSLLVAVPASFFVTISRPTALLQRRLHMVGSVICGWRGVKQLCGKAVFPLRDEDLFPTGTTKLNGVKFYGDRNSDEVLSYTTSLICHAGGSLAPVFRQMLESRDGILHSVVNFQNYGSGGIGGEICQEPVLLGSLEFLQDMGVDIPEGTMVSQAVYVAIDGQLAAVFAISYAKMRSSAAGIISLCGSRKLKPILIGNDFMITGSLLRAKFKINTRRVGFPPQEVRDILADFPQDPELPALALATRDDLVSFAYAAAGARTLRTSVSLGMLLHLLGGVLGILIMAVLAYLGNTELLTPTHILLYQLVWMVPGLLITEWARTV